VRRLWAYGRIREWDLLRSVFHPDATVHVSWFKGPASEFVARSAELAKLRKPEEHGKHWFGNMRTTIRGRRAVQETDVQILVREYLDEHLFDHTAPRGFTTCSSSEGSWKFQHDLHLRRTASSGTPGSVPPSFSRDCR
jgi:hypothetical protein